MNTFWTEQQIKVHRLINNSQGLQKVMVKDFPVKYYSMKCFTFWEDINTIINSQYREQLIYYKHIIFPLFFPDSDDRLSLNFHRFVYKLWYTKCGSLDNTVLSMMCYCLKESLLQRKMSNWVLRFTTFQIDMKIVEFFFFVFWGRVSDFIL